MKFRGPLGFSRLTSVGPLVSPSASYSNKLSADSANRIAELAAEDIQINDRSDLSNSEREKMISEMSSTIYSDNTKAARWKRLRFENCMFNLWANNWAEGLEENDSTTYADEVEKLAMMARGCKGMTESNTADSEELLPPPFQ